MKIIPLYFFCIIFPAWTYSQTFSGESDIVVLDSKFPQVVVLSPDGGEYYQQITYLPVGWDANDDSFDDFPVTIDFILPGYQRNLATELPNSGNANPECPLRITDSAKIIITVIDIFGNQNADTSDSFFSLNNRIFANSPASTVDSKMPEITLISPNGGENFVQAFQTDVLWSATDDSFGSTPIDLSLIVNSGRTDTMATQVVNSGSLSVDLPTIVTDEAKMILSATDDFGNITLDSSDQHFSISNYLIAESGTVTMDSKKPEINLIHPANKEIILADSLYEIEFGFSEDLLPDNPMSAYYQESPQSNYAPILEQAPFQNPINWQVPYIDTDSANLKIQVVDAFGNIGLDSVEGFFEIRDFVPLFHKNKYKVYAGEPVQFIDDSYPNPVYWAWDFDEDGIIDSYDQNPEWTYYTVGLYDVTLTVSNGTDTVSWSQQDYVYVNPCQTFYHSSSIYENTIWIEGTHFIESDLTVYYGSQLTIQPGAVIKFAPGADLDVLGSLDAQGTITDTIVFTSRDDNYYGCTHPDSDGWPQPGDWDKINLYGSGNPEGYFDHCIIQYGGQNNGSSMVTFAGATGYINNSRVRQSNANGIYQGSDMDIYNCFITNNTQNGVIVYGGSVNIDECEFMNNGGYPVYINGGVMKNALNGNYTSGNFMEGFAVNYVSYDADSIAIFQSSSYDQIPFIILGTVSAYAGFDIDIKPGTVFKMDPSGNFYIRGTFSASNAIFTSINDDEVFGDTNNDGDLTSPAPGDWKGIHTLYQDAFASIDDCIIKYGGSNSSNVPIYITNGSSGFINNSTIKFSGSYAIYHSGYQVTITNCTLENNLNHSIMCYQTDSIVISGNLIKNNQGDGIRIIGSVDPDIDNNQFLNNSGYPIYKSGGTYSQQYSGNSSSGNLMEGIYVAGLSGESHQTIHAAENLPYLVNNFTISSGDTIEIKPGAILKFFDNKELINYGGVLKADSAVFTSIFDDNFGGDSNNDVNTTVAAPGDWDGIESNNATTECYLDGCTLLNGGSSAGVLFGGHKGRIENCYIAHNNRPGIQLGGKNVDIVGNTIEYNDYQGVHLPGADSLEFTGNIIRNNNGEGVRISSESLGLTFRGNTFENNTGSGVYLSVSSNSTVDFGAAADDQGNNVFTGNDEGVYDFYNASQATIPAYYNQWDYTIADSIDTHIYDDDEYYLMGEVLFDPWIGKEIQLDLKVFLEGPFDAGEMTTSLNPLDIPLTQPYNIAPWNYSGTESIAAMPNTDVVDWVLIELRDASEAAFASGATMIAQLAVLLLKDGSVVGINGTDYARVVPTGHISDSLFVVIWHRNHLGVLSANALIESGGVYSYDFSSGADQVYGGANGHKELTPGVWGMVAADGDADGQINNGDKNAVWTIEAGNSGYLSGDFNMDSQVNNADKNDLWVPNSGSGGQVPASADGDSGKPASPENKSGKPDSATGFESQVPE